MIGAMIGELEAETQSWNLKLLSMNGEPEVQVSDDNPDPQWLALGAMPKHIL